MGRALSRLSGFLVLKLVINSNAAQEEKARAFGVPLVTVKRYVKLYREGGAAAFFPTRGPTIIRTKTYAKFRSPKPQRLGNAGGSALDHVPCIP